MPDGTVRTVADQIIESQIQALHSAVDAGTSKQEANYQALRAELTSISRDTNEIRVDVKGLDKRVGSVETDVAFMKGQRSGGNAMYAAVIGLGGLIIGIVTTALAILQMGVH